jgi:DNA-binding transcriptional LysR family regulator
MQTACPTRIFAERLAGDVAPPFSRRTSRLERIVHHLGLSLGGRPAVELAERLMFPVSNDTLLRVVRRHAVAPDDSPRVIGIDDWAWRRGQRYGTVVCDLERRRIIDLLPDREPATLDAWLGAHPSIEVIARDRGGGCAPSFAAQWLSPRLSRLLRDHPGIEVRLAASTDYTRFLNDEFDADIVYGMPRQEGLIVLPLGEETVTPLCSPDLAREIHTPMDLFNKVLIESDNKQIRWSTWFARNDLPAPRPHGVRFDRSFLAIAAAVDGLGVALESTRLAEREIASGRLLRPLVGRAEDVRYVGHYLLFPRSTRQRHSLQLFTKWLSAELGLEVGPVF